MTDREDPRLRDKVERFVGEIEDTVIGALECAFEPDPLSVKELKGAPGEVFVAYGFRATARVCGEPTYRLECFFAIVWNSTKEFLAVNESSFKLFVEGSNEPLFHYDYFRNVQGDIPAAHINIHHHRPEVKAAIEKSGNRYRGKGHNRRVRNGEDTRDSALHYPVGGPRFRPALEDVVQFIIYELGADPTAEWEVVLNDGRRRWREMQLKSAVNDNLYVAAEMLREAGFRVTGGPEEDPDLRRIHEL